jgi:4-amino-4-deoxy-L-arabinose transferase-like glycosyltransferase
MRLPRLWQRGVWPLVTLVLTGALLRFWRLGSVALIGDEAYYWLWSRHLAPSYFDNPAGTAFMVRLSTIVGGESEAGIRWLNALLGLGAVFWVYAIASRLFTRAAAFWSAGVVALGAPYLIVSRFVYTDVLQLFFLLQTVYFLIPFLSKAESAHTSPATWRFWAVSLSAVALLNTKYSAYLCVLALAVLVALMRRDLLRDPRAWWSVVVVGCGLVPVLAWNAAHQWSSFRWQLSHFLLGGIHSSTPWGNVWHAIWYLTPPLALFALVGVTQVVGPVRQILLLPAIASTVPVVLSPADSPRNLVAGLALLIILAGDVVVRVLGRLPKWSSGLAFGAPVLLAGVYGFGSILQTWRPVLLPHSTIAPSIRQASAGWRAADQLGLDSTAYAFAVDYDIAAQLRYYTDLPVQTSWGQYRIWGVPKFCPSQPGRVDDVTVIALGYVDPELISQRLALAFADVSEPRETVFADGGMSKSVHTWRASGCFVDLSSFLDLLDLIELVRADQTYR